MKDLRTAPSREAQSDKSKGLARKMEGAPQTAAQTHAVLRARSGFGINQLVAEYRALRASVLRLWMDAHPPVASSIEDLVRFNEAIDQAVAGSVGHFHTEVERARDLLVGMLGHDMRNPLDTILLSSRYLASLNAGEEVSLVAQRLIHSGASMRVRSHGGRRRDGAATDDLGLGLFIVREIVNAHEGEVEVRSRQGMTTFSVRLPRHLATPARPKRARIDTP